MGGGGKIVGGGGGGLLRMQSALPCITARRMFVGPKAQHMYEWSLAISLEWQLLMKSQFAPQEASCTAMGKPMISLLFMRVN